MLSELRARGVIRTLNAPSGDLAETLTERAYQSELAPNSEKSWDVRAADGRFLQVKSRVSAADETVAARSTSTKRLTCAATSSSAHSTPSNSGADSPLARTNSPSPTEAELSGRHHRLATWIGRHALGAARGDGCPPERQPERHIGRGAHAQVDGRLLRPPASRPPTASQRMPPAHPPGAGRPAEAGAPCNLRPLSKPAPRGAQPPIVASAARGYTDP